MIFGFGIYEQLIKGEFKNAAISVYESLKKQAESSFLLSPGFLTMTLLFILSTFRMKLKNRKSRLEKVKKGRDLQAARNRPAEPQQ